MATPELEREVTDLKRRLKRLEKTVADHVGEDRAPSHSQTFDIERSTIPGKKGTGKGPVLPHSDREGPTLLQYNLPSGPMKEPAPSYTEQEMSNPQQLLAWMRAEGLIIDPPSECLAHSERWSVLTEAEKRDILWELDHLTPGPMASEIISEGRR